MGLVPRQKSFCALTLLRPAGIRPFSTPPCSQVACGWGPRFRVTSSAKANTMHKNFFDEVLVDANIILANPSKREPRSMEIAAWVDTGALHSCTLPHVALQWELQKLEKRELTLAVNPASPNIPISMAK